MKMKIEQLKLTDSLAIDRTHLANQRTLLSYLRTGLYLVIAALAIFQLKDEKEITIAAWYMIGVGAFVALIGIINYFLMRRKIKKSYSKSEA